MFSRAHQAWRQHPALRSSENVKKILPGFGTAAAIFGAYVFVEALYNQITATNTQKSTAPAKSAH